MLAVDVDSSVDWTPVTIEAWVCEANKKKIEEGIQEDIVCYTSEVANKHLKQGERYRLNMMLPAWVVSGELRRGACVREMNGCMVVNLSGLGLPYGIDVDYSQPYGFELDKPMLYSVN